MDGVVLAGVAAPGRDEMGHGRRETYTRGVVSERLAATLLVVLLPALAAAAGTPPAVTPAAPRGTPVATPAPPKTSSVTGALVAVDVAAATVTLVRPYQQTKPPRAPERLTLAVTPSTQLFRGSRPVTLGELHPGDHVVIRYQILPGGGRALSVRAADPVGPSPTVTPLPVAPAAAPSAH